MSEGSSFTFREAVLSSVIAHAGVFILVLLFPGALSRTTPSADADPNAPIPLAFLQEPPVPNEASPLQMADAGDRNASDPRPDDAPPAQSDDPFSVGNNPNPFLAEPTTQPPSPTPGSVVVPEPAAAGEESTVEDPIARDSAIAENDLPLLSDARDPERAERFLGAPEGNEGQGTSGQSGKSGSLREALGRMSIGMSDGGSPLRFDNPVGGLRGPSGGLSFDTKGFDWGPYARKIYWIIWTNWTQGWPPAAWAGMQGVVKVRFHIWRDGTITGVEVLEASGTPAFDSCATVALEASSPLPPLPADFLSESEGVTARFFYNMKAN